MARIAATSCTESIRFEPPRVPVGARGSMGLVRQEHHRVDVLDEAQLSMHTVIAAIYLTRTTTRSSS
jgi:hypothetical protein